MQDGEVIVVQRDGFFGYKLHLISTTSDLVVPLNADVTTAIVPDNKMYFL